MAKAKGTGSKALSGPRWPRGLTKSRVPGTPKPARNTMQTGRPALSGTTTESGR